MYREGQTNRLAVPVSEEDHSRGRSDAPVTLVEYGDFECDNCGEAFPIVKSIQSRMGDKLRFVYRCFPLTEIHPHAEQAAEAAEAAAAQGKFWEMHDILFENQTELGVRSLENYAARIGLDRERFTHELMGRMYFPRVKEEFEGGLKSGVDGTPTFFINGEFYEGSYDEESLLDACQEAAQESRVGARSGKNRGTAKKTKRPG